MMKILLLVMTIAYITIYVKAMKTTRKTLFYNKDERKAYFIKSMSEVKTTYNKSHPNISVKENDEIAVISYGIVMIIMYIFFTIYYIMASIIVTNFIFTVLSAILIADGWYSGIKTTSWLNNYDKINFRSNAFTIIFEYILHFTYIGITVYHIYLSY